MTPEDAAVHTVLVRSFAAALESQLPAIESVARALAVDALQQLERQPDDPAAFVEAHTAILVLTFRRALTHVEESRLRAINAALAAHVPAGFRPQ